MRLTIKRQGGGILFERNISRGWTYLGGSLGAWMTPHGSVRLTNGVCDGEWAGAVKHAGIELRESRLMPARKFGTGQDVLLPRGSFRMRHPKEPAPVASTTFAYACGPRIPWSPTFASLGVWWEYPRMLSGMYPVTGERQRDTGGAKGIQPLSGFEWNSLGVVERSDAMMNRTPLDAFNVTGRPWIIPPGFDYSDDFYYGASTQLPQFAARVSTDQWDSRRKPRDWDGAPGSCPYYADLVGYPNPYNSWMPSNHQHAVRHLAPVIGAANRGDALSLIDLATLAHNGTMAQPFAPAVEPGKGSTYYGRREVAHRMLGWSNVPTYAALCQSHVDQTCAAQMPNGAIENLPYDSSLNPNPWDQLGLERTKRVVPTMEHFLTLNMLARAGKTAEVRKGLAGIFDVLPASVLAFGVPKFLVTQEGGEIRTTLHEGVGGSDFFPWLALGALAALDPAHPDWQRWALTIPVPKEENRGGRRASDLRDLREMLRVWQGGRSQTVGLLSVLETLPL